MPVDFFSYAEAIPTQKDFAIHDDQDQKPVYMEHIGDSEGQVVVVSNNRTDYFFIPVDHNIPLKRADGSDDEICDAMLYTDNTLCFIEIKCRRAKGWVSKAAGQIASTIGHFDRNHPEHPQRFKDAYICNWKRRNSLVKESHNEMKDNFLKDYKTHLYISNTIAEFV